MNDIDIGQISEALNNKVDLPSPTIPQDAVDYVVEMQNPTANNNYTWYRKYKSGWVEQGGENTNSAQDYQVTLPIIMSNIHYTITFGGKSFGSNNNAFICNVKSDSLTTSGFKIQGRDYNNGNYTQISWWKVEGMAA